MNSHSIRIHDIRSLLRGGFSDEQIARFTGATWLSILSERGEAASAPRSREVEEWQELARQPSSSDAPSTDGR